MTTGSFYHLQFAKILSKLPFAAFMLRGTLTRFIGEYMDILMIAVILLCSAVIILIADFCDRQIKR